MILNFVLWEAVICNRSQSLYYTALHCVPHCWIIYINLTIWAASVITTSENIIRALDLNWDSDFMFLNFYFFAINFQNQKTNDQKYNINFWKSIHWIIFLFSYTRQKTLSKDKVQVASASA